MTKRLALLFAIAVLAALLVPTLAFANYGVHGGYTNDTDACAGCHRAHTSVSTITWTPVSGAGPRSALLVTSATNMYEFCYACHDATSEGSILNVQEGVYEVLQPDPDGAGPLGPYFPSLNGGGFESYNGAATTSNHNFNGKSWGAYGGGWTGNGAADNWASRVNSPTAGAPQANGELRHRHGARTWASPSSSRWTAVRATILTARRTTAS